MDIVIVGAGNIAHYFSQLLRLNGHQIRQVFSRNEAHAKELAGSLNTSWINDPDDLEMNADIYLLAVSDDSLPVLNKELHLGKRMVAHTSGAVPLTAIQNISVNTGVIYPVQSIRQKIPLHHKFPVLIEAVNKTVLKRLWAIGEGISDNIIEMNSKDRLKVHLAAVFCNNFPNHLISLCKNYCEKESLDFDLLRPLMKETFQRLENMHPDELQTGPALRGDTATMEKHLEILDPYPEMKKIYYLLSESIKKYFSNKITS